MKQALMLNTRRSGYGPEQVDEYTMTVGELRELLDEYDDDVKVLFKNDNGYTYGEVWDSCFEFEYYKGEDEEDDE